jgi:signal peptide peptidase SppA
MPNLTRVMTALYCQPWLITATMHHRLCELASAHINGEAHKEDGNAAKKHAENHGPLAKDGDGLEWWQIWNRGKAESNGVSFSDGVAIFDVSGVIGRKFSSFLNSSGVTSVDVLSRMIRAAADDARVSGILMDIDSPGGTVTGVPEAAASVAYATTKKPTVAFTGGMACSAAYWLSAPCDAIIAESSADVGSIGVYSALLDSSRAYEVAGLKMNLFKTGKYKGMGMPGVPVTDDQRALMQADVDKVFEWFRSAVIGNRGKVPDEAMQGQSMFAADALKNGLIDRIGNFDDALDYVKKQKGMRK